MENQAPVVLMFFIERQRKRGREGRTERKRERIRAKVGNTYYMKRNDKNNSFQN